MGRYEVSQRRAAMAARFHRSSLRYQSQRDPLTALRQRLRELAQTRVRLGTDVCWSSCDEKAGRWAKNALSRVHRGGTGAATETTVASRDGGTPRAATPIDEAE